MPSGTIYGTTSNEYISAKIEWSYTQNIANNTSTVTAALYYKRTNSGYTTNGTGSFSVIIGNYSEGVDYKHLTITETAWVKAVEATWTVTHNSDGTMSIYIGGSGQIPSTTLTSTNCASMITLATIPRATIISAIKTPTTLGSNCYMMWIPGSASFCYKLKFSLGSWSHTTGVIKPNTTAQYYYTGYTLPMEVANQFPTATSGTMTATLYTYTSEVATTHIGTPVESTFTVTLPDNESTKPSVSMSLSPLSTLSSPYNTMYIQGLSKVKATLSIDTKYGASVVASSITVNGDSYDSPYETSILSQSGKVSVKATVKDSRGYYGTYYKEIEVIPYAKPYLQAFSGESSIIAARCDKSANFTDSGTYLKIKAKAVVSKVISGGVQNNYGNIKFRYRKEGGSYSSWQTILSGKTDNSDEVITPPLLNGALEEQSNYQVQIVAFDDFYDSATITMSVPSGAVYMDRPAGGKSMGLGGYSSGDGKLDIYWKTIARGGLSLTDSKGDEIPLGTTMPLPRGQVASGYNPDNLGMGVYIVANNIALKIGETVIMYNGVLIQMAGDVGGNVKIQLALPTDTNRNPMFRLCWYSNWTDWRSLKL